MTQTTSRRSRRRNTTGRLGVPITSQTVEAVGGTTQENGKNMFVLGLVARIFEMDVPKLAGMLQKDFCGKGKDVVRHVLMAFHAGHAFNLPRWTERYLFETSTIRFGVRKVVTVGNQALAYGAIAAVVRFGAAYPITPWSSIMEILCAELPKYGGVFVQADAAISMACGASYAGYLALTGTSGPGMALKSEAIGWAVMVDVQRGGPATGLPTNVEQSDLNIALSGSHGDCPRIVLAPSSVEDCFYTAMEAVKLAREYSCPVIVLSDQALATRIEAWEMPDLAKCMKEITPTFALKGTNFKPYENTMDGEAVSTLHLRYLWPLQPGIQEILRSFHHVLVAELNDEGMFGYGQLGGILRAIYCDPRIRGINKTDGLPFKVQEILDQMRLRISFCAPASKDAFA